MKISNKRISHKYIDITTEAGLQEKENLLLDGYKVVKVNPTIEELEKVWFVDYEMSEAEVEQERIREEDLKNMEETFERSIKTAMTLLPVGTVITREDVKKASECTVSLPPYSSFPSEDLEERLEMYIGFTLK